MRSYLYWLLHLKKVLVGLRAFTVQFYTEANVKNGLQFEASFDSVGVAATTGKIDAIMITGSKPVIVKARVMDFVGKKVRASVFRGPTYTGGTPLTVYNLNDIGPVATTVSLLAAPTVTATGTQFGAPNTVYGSDLQGNSVQGTFAVTGQERVLQANTTYLLRIENLGDTVANIAGYLTWYEGTPDLPADQESV